MRLFQKLVLYFCFAALPVFTVCSDLHAQHSPGEALPDTRCSVCGMFVAKYPNWLTQIHYDDQKQVQFFDGVKDMMVFSFNPEKFNAPPGKR